MFTTIKLKAKDRSCKAFFGFYFGLSFLEDVQQPLSRHTFLKGENFVANILIKAVKWCCTIKVDIENSKGQYIEKDKQEATKDGSESTKIQHGI